MSMELTCEGGEWQHHRVECELQYRQKYGKPCMSKDSIHVILSKKK